MREAARLLRESDLPIAGVAAAVGYENQGKFTRAFKEAVGLLPTEYRRQNGPQRGKQFPGVSHQYAEMQNAPSKSRAARHTETLRSSLFPIH